MPVNLFFNWLWIGELLTFKTGPPCSFQSIYTLTIKSVGWIFALFTNSEYTKNILAETTLISTPSR